MTPLEIATEAARLGAEVLIGYWGNLSREDADLKARNDWVSRADRESEAVIIDYLRKQCPGDAMLGEETGRTDASIASVADAARTWIVDPLDGTTNYLQHFPFWSISIALRDGADMVAGVVYEPLRDQLFAAERGSGAYQNGNRLRVSEHSELEGSFLATGFPFRSQRHVGVYCSLFHDVISVAKGVRRAGSAALDLAYTASGVFDGFFEMQLGPWDVAAGALLVQEAGGIVTDFSGGNTFWSKGNIVGAGNRLHGELLSLINRHTSEEQLA